MKLFVPAWFASRDSCCSYVGTSNPYLSQRCVPDYKL